MEFDYYNWLILPGLIFLARVCDVSISTIRVLTVISGRKKIAPFLGAIEVTIWLLAIGQIMQHLDNVACYIGYAAGFAMGTYVGMQIEERLAFGNYVIRIITDNAQVLVEHLRNLQYSVTCLHAEGNSGDVNVIFLVIKRKEFEDIVQVIKRFNPQAYYTVASIKHVDAGGFAPQNSISGKGTMKGFFYSVFRKSK
ncbi:MAG: DUF2179 domain-containing protein [Bacteroidota bacterium]|nr:DUF2179 domain-containing protein [Bacteroidota bacterium]